MSTINTNLKQAQVNMKPVAVSVLPDIESAESEEEQPISGINEAKEEYNLRHEEINKE